MPKNIISTIVFVGKELNTSMFDERGLQDMFGPLKGDQIKAGPVGQFRYANGQASFSVTPDRVDIRCEGREILPPALQRAGMEVVRQLEPIRGLISAVGINCDTSFYQQEIGKEGYEFCQALTATELHRQIHEGHENVRITSVASTFMSGAIIYNIRLEPENASRGRDFFAALNAHQNVTLADDLTQKLTAIEEVRGQVEELHQHIQQSKGE